MAMAEPRLVRLFQLISPCQPTGAFSYSQGLEWAVAEGWIATASHLADWLQDILAHSLGRVDVPILGQLHAACTGQDLAGFTASIDLLLACRESRELREEEGHRGKAMSAWLAGLGLAGDAAWRKAAARSQLAGFALAAATWEIAPLAAATGYLYAWLENQIIAGVKLIPLGQSDGQSLLLRLSDLIMEVATAGIDLLPEDIGGSAPALALASMAHETQYTRLYRS